MTITSSLTDASPRPIGVLAGPRTSFLDHLIPLCHLFNAPLLCTDPWVYACAELFYPPMPLLFATGETFQQILSDYQTFITVEPCRLHATAFQFGDFIYRGEGKTVAGFHGNPDKFRDLYWMERYADEDLVLTYGEYSRHYLQEKGVWGRLKQSSSIGNLRHRFYETHRSFFDRHVQSALQEEEAPLIFFAPTWSYPTPDPLCLTLCETLPSSFRLLIKLHPFTYRLYPDFVARLQNMIADHPRIELVGEIPLIYPFIEKSAYYLGDSSSVAFDFLSVNRPLFFIGEKTYPWGIQVKEIEKLWTVLTQPDTLAEKRRAAYKEVFDEGDRDFTGR